MTWPRSAPEMREALRDNRDELGLIARRVRHGACQCCGGEGEPMACGHVRCELCTMRDHVCLACAVAM